MKIEDKKLFISEYSQMIQNKDYLEVIEKLKKQIEIRRKSVFDKYTSVGGGHLIENQLYNEKNSAVEVLSIMLEAKEEFEKISLPGLKYIIEELNDRIKGHTEMIEKSIGGLQNGLTMSVYTETDIILRGANALEDITTSYEKEIENLKKVDENDTTLTEVQED